MNDDVAARHDFDGAKLVLLAPKGLVTILRDDKPDIPFPNMWDLPGGGREGAETPEACVMRETREELGLVLAEDRLLWSKPYHESPTVWAFAARVTDAEVAAITFGDEGQRWTIMEPEHWLSRSDTVPPLRLRVRDAVTALTAA